MTNKQTNKQTNRIILAADCRYAEQVITTIKSICYHNANVLFYLFNNDISTEWFIALRKQLNEIGSDIVDVKMDFEAELRQFKTLDHIQTTATFFRYFIADAISAYERESADRNVLYLDCDLVVTGSLQPLFDRDIGDNYVAACVDDLSDYHQRKEFNAGVMLVNYKRWKKENIREKAMALSKERIHELPSSDQSILNLLFENQWEKLPYQWNYLAGAEGLYRYAKFPRLDLILRQDNEIPIIIHYNTKFKPWLPYYNLPLREQYWFYYNLSWKEIRKKQKIIK